MCPVWGFIVRYFGIYNFEVVVYQIEALKNFSSAVLKKGLVSNKVIFFIGLTSLLTDLATEMVASVMPNFLYSVLMLPPLLVGLVDGLYQGFAAILRLPAGYWTDRAKAYRGIAFVGYTFSCIAKLFLLLAIPFGLLMALVGLALDRIGKAIRTAPRDHLIAMHSKQGQLSTSFGLHRSMDAIGAFLGPIFAFLLLYFFSENYQIILIVSFFIALAGLFAFRMGVPRPISVASDVPQEDAQMKEKERIHIKSAHSFLPEKTTIFFLFFCFLLNLFVVGDGLLYLQLQQAGLVSQDYLPLLFSGTALVFVFLAYPVGVLADRLGNFKPLAAGFLIIVFLYGVLAAGWLISSGGIVFILVGMGAFYAATDGVLVAQIIKFTAPEKRTTALAIFGAVVGLARFFSSLLFGFLWQMWGSKVAFATFSISLLMSVILFLVTYSRYQVGKEQGK